MELASLALILTSITPCRAFEESVEKCSRAGYGIADPCTRRHGSSLNVKGEQADCRKMAAKCGRPNTSCHCKTMNVSTICSYAFSRVHV